MLASRNEAVFRNSFEASVTYRSYSRMSSSDFTEKLSLAESLNLCLLLPDTEIVSGLEELIFRDEIRIPLTEVRSSIFGPQTDTQLECSRDGVRTVHRSNLSVLRLKSAVRNLHKSPEQQQALEWKLKYTQGQNLGAKLENYLFSRSPQEAVKQLIFDNPDNVALTLKQLQYGYFIDPRSLEDENRVIDKIVWKLGFDSRNFPDNLLLSRANRLSQVSKSVVSDSEIDRENVRSAGANFFVSLEDMLDSALFFTGWFLLSDHFIKTRFNYNPEEARIFVASELNRHQDKVVFDESGKNTLFGLVNGFQVLASLCRRLMADAEALARPERELPHFVGRSDMLTFPFMHRILLLDLEGSELDEILELLESTTKTLNQSNVCDIRNRIDHKRNDFPNATEIDNMCKTTTGLFLKLEEVGLYPTLYYLFSTRNDLHGRMQLFYRDHSGREVGIFRTYELDACGLPSIDSPSIVVPAIHLGDSSQPARFKLWETSDFTSAWKDFPKRKVREEIESSMESEDSTEVNGTNSEGLNPQ